LILKIIVFDLGGTLMQYVGMPLSWVDFYEQGFESIIQKYGGNVSKVDVDKSLQILKDFNPRVNYREEEYLAEHIFAETDCIINLASKEYSLCISKYLRPDIRFITCIFGEEKDDKIIEKGTMCKMARGEMVRYMAEHQIENPEDIRAFDRLDYTFDPAHSDENTYVFVKRGKPLCSLD
jgi:hypothetical protein